MKRYQNTIPKRVVKPIPKPIQKQPSKPRTIQEKENDLLDLLDIVIQLMMLVEKLEDFKIENHYNVSQVKKASKNLLDIITPLAERDYQIVFRNGEKETHGIIREYEMLVAQMRDYKVPEKVILNQMIQAFNIDKKTIEATCHRVLKKGL